MQIHKFFLLVTFLIPSFNVLSQNQRLTENDLLKSFKKIDYWYGKMDNNAINASDSISAANINFATKLLRFTKINSSSLNLPFNLFRKEPLNICTSNDNLFRIYSWDTETGGTMHFFESVFQYKTGSKSKSELDTVTVEGDVRPFYDKLYTLKANDKTYYIATFLFIVSTKDRSAGVQIFAIENGGLNKNVAIIKTKTGLHSKLSYDYDNAYSDPKNDPSVRFDPVKQIISIPLVVENGRVTSNFITYKFNGRYFEKIKK